MAITRGIRAVAYVTALLFGATCVVQREAERGELQEGTGSVIAYTTLGGVRHPFEGQARIGGNSLVLTGQERLANGQKSPVQERTLPLNQVTSVELRYVNGWATLGLVLLITVLTLGVLAGIAAATKSSCPFIYSWDGEKYVFDGEPYGGAIMPALARTDWSELKHLKEERGEYRLLLTNEVDETQHTDRLGLLVVDHVPGERVVMGYDGRPHLFTEVTPPSRARDQAGTDLLPFLRAVDGVSWIPQLETRAQELPLQDTRDHLTVEFSRPSGDRVWLLATVATAPWGSTQIRTLLGMRGTEASAWLRSVNSDASARTALLAWNEREELFHLGVEVEVDGRWERRSTLIAGGPFIAETRAASLDLRGVKGPVVRLRVHPPVGFWRIEALELAGEGRTVEPVRLPARVAMDQAGHDVRARLEAKDGLTLDQPEPGAVTRLTFVAPPLAPGLERSVFAETHGWYEVHLHDLGAPETANLKRLEQETGYAVQRALEDYAAFRRTGRVPFTAVRGQSATFDHR